MSPPVPVDLSALAEVFGVTGFILVDAGGHPLRQMNEPATRRLAAALVQWGKQCAKVRKGFRYLLFARINGERVAMYRVGPNYLGVVLANHPDAKGSVEEIFTIINRLASGDSRHSGAIAHNETEAPHEH